MVDRRSGDLTVQERRQAFEAELQLVLKPLYTTALTYVHHREDAEDLVQEVVLRAWRSYERFEPGTNFKAWMLRILTNLCINRFHRGERSVKAVGFDEVEREAEKAGSQLQSAKVKPGAELFDRMLDEDVHAALADLPAEFRTAVVLSDVQELTYQQISTVLEVPLGTVRSRIFRGRRLLRQTLLHYALKRGLIREEDVV